MNTDYNFGFSPDPFYADLTTDPLLIVESPKGGMDTGEDTIVVDTGEWDELSCQPSAPKGQIESEPSDKNRRRSDRIVSLANQQKLMSVNPELELLPARIVVKKETRESSKTEQRKKRNREAQAACRQRKAERYQSLEKECDQLRKDNAFLNSRVPDLERQLMQLKRENSRLKVDQQRCRRRAIIKLQGACRQGSLNIQQLKDKFCTIIEEQKRLRGDLTHLHQENEYLKALLKNQTQINFLFSQTICSEELGSDYSELHM